MKKNDSNKESKIWLILRWVIPIFIFPIFFIKKDINLYFYDLNNWSKYFASLIILIVVFLLIMLYKRFICKFWNFLKKDSIVHYIFLAVIPAIILFFGYQIIMKGPNHSPTYNMTQYDEIIDRLNGFYSSLFTAIAVIAAILALGAWRTIKELREKLEKFKEVEGKVDFLHEKKDLARWAQDLFDKDERKRIISSDELPIESSDDKKKCERIKKKLIEDATDDAWLMIVYAKKLMENARKERERIKHFSVEEQKMDLQVIEETYESVQKIFEFIENKDMLDTDTDSDVKTTLLNLQGKVHWELYKTRKLKIEEKALLNEAKEDLENAKKYYQKALNIAEKKRETADETRGNLALVLIESYKFSKDEGELKRAIEYLEEIYVKDFNTYWDHARALYYLNPDENENKINELLDKAVEEIDNKKDKNYFLEKLEEQLNEKIDGKSGFPGNQEIINDKRKALADKNLF